MTRAVMICPFGPDRGLWLDECLEYCKVNDYEAASVAGAWADACAALASGEADIVVVARPEHLPADRQPRVEIVSERYE